MHLIRVERVVAAVGAAAASLPELVHGERGEGCLEQPGPWQGTETTHVSTEGSRRGVVNWVSGEPRSQDMSTRYHGGSNGRKLLPPRRG